MRFLIFNLCSLLIVSSFLPGTAAALSLQALIDRTPAGQAVPLTAGTYFGPVEINKPVVLDGKGKVIIDGQGKGSIVIIKADGVVLKNLTLTRTGNSHDRVDAGILIRSSDNKILNNRIHNALFGIDLKESHRNQIIGNDISSKKFDLGLRGDGIRVWASHRNIFRHNKIHDSRDMVIWYSNDNIIEENEAWNNRYSLHFMYAGGNIVKRNRYHHNAVGIFLMYSIDTVVEHNDIRYSLGGTGVGIGLKETDNTTIQYNNIVYCTTALYFDLSPYQPDTYNFIKANRIGYNMTGIGFNSSLSRNILKGNAFIHNLETVAVHANGTAAQNLWEGNYYSNYQGFDRNRDGYGDAAYHQNAYLDSLWMDNPWMRFFFGSPVISMVNFLARLAPISQPRHIMTDQNPVFSLTSDLLVSEKNLSHDLAKIMLDRRQADVNDDEEDDDDELVPARFAESSQEEEENDLTAEDEIDQEENQTDNFNRYYLKQ